MDSACYWILNCKNSIKKEYFGKLKKSICFIAFNAYPLIKKTSGELVGGAELQQVLIGKELDVRGYAVSYITLDHDQGLVSKAGPFNVFSTFKSAKGVPGLRFFYPRLVKIWQALNRSNSDIYYCRCAGFLLGVVVLWARLNKKIVIFCGAIDSDFDPKNIQLKHCRDKIIYYWGLKRCSAIVVQNGEQKIDLKKNFQRNGFIIHNGMDKIEKVSSLRNSILWVANIKAKKNPNAFIDLVKRLPGENFVMVGGKTKGQERLYDYVIRESKMLPNLKFWGGLPLEETEKEFDKAKLFVNTSFWEGFPNTFLQAWRQGIPVISFIDPDGLIAKHSLGQVVKNNEDMFDNVKMFLCQNSNKQSEIIKTYFDENLVIEKQVDKYEEIFKLFVKCDG
jgi:glycosyltransferase involved in cell wall biosynthesis